jgi:Cu(I)/Ag(I) efflux system membrane protein CusA/SilA
VVIPIVLLVIFVLLYFTYHSALEAAHVLLAVPFALTGGIYLLWLLGYNFSVAVWVGFIALFGTAVQTAVVMVISLEEAVERKRVEFGGRLTRAGLKEAVIDGALLRLRPKVMTVSTVIAGLLPIMWSTSVGAEVMKPLATPVLGGMISSLLHVLVVTPVLFFWIRERRLGLQDQAAPASEGSPVVWRTVGAAVVLAAIVGAGILGWREYHPRPDSDTPRDLTAIQEVSAGDLRIVLLSATGSLRLGRNTYTIEIRSRDGTLVDVGTVRATANMAMPGMVMPGGVELRRTSVAGRYEATAEFGMAGAWQMALEWDGPAGRGSVSFAGAVQ